MSPNKWHLNINVFSAYFDWFKGDTRMVVHPTWNTLMKNSSGKLRTFLINLNIIWRFFRKDQQ